MANLLDLRNRINSTKNTGQITKALEMVSASRQKKAQDFLNNSRFLRIGIRELMSQIQSIKNIDAESAHKLPWFFRNHESDKVLFVSLMSQRGLCGSMNTNLFYEILRTKKKIDKNIEFISINKMAQKYLKNFDEPIISYFKDIKENPLMDDVIHITEFIKDSYNKYESIYLAYTKFEKSGIFIPQVVQLLPIQNLKNEKVESKELDYIVEPDPYTLLGSLANIFIDLEVYEAVLSNQASEHSARMIAMKQATDNVKEIVKDLTLKLNKERQAKITQAVAEISANI